jgi:ABC-type bacteriocin/lantibiotic exporter with double-glycine peptidase domain
VLAAVLAAVLLYALLRIGLYRALRHRSEEGIRTRAQEQSTFGTACTANRTALHWQPPVWRGPCRS